MKLKINTTTFDLIDIFTNMSQAITLSICENLRDSREVFIKGRDFLIENTFEFDDNIENILLIETQIEILDKNITTLENALLCHESKCIEKRPSLKDLQSIGLN